MGDRRSLVVPVLRGAALTAAGLLLPTVGVWQGVRTGQWTLGVTLCVLGALSLATGPIWQAADKARRTQVVVALLALAAPLLPGYCGTLADQISFEDLSRYGTTVTCQVRGMSSETIQAGDSGPNEITTYDYALACPTGALSHRTTVTATAGRTLELRLDPQGRTTAVLTTWEYEDYAQKQRLMPWFLAGLLVAVAVAWTFALLPPRRRPQTYELNVADGTIEPR
ncbi:hypothetical protein [Nonomuraea sp. NPDC046570]|uniref:hypothetical protein n=1 Tax=Nonomuraea sp. NPDC046570 TaxID=3155255 RepID=UPI0033D309F4